jgi:hypothetical protein
MTDTTTHALDVGAERLPALDLCDSCMEQLSPEVVCSHGLSAEIAVMHSTLADVRRTHGYGRDSQLPNLELTTASSF